ncbi:hypothetical protein CUJ83_09560 [Methanocella sp. CWC-04]|uniref:Uncharacterized protein n=1 Tax=Methanooceanicella nereidis TaxID=2052831 RepID=A0AAP2W7I8_9EURY|nr:hypothetical protein [Methanocella sp. CWC-04]MCD1295244.1 hypothetical protein [Methanocella sp. CWC-04]
MINLTSKTIRLTFITLTIIAFILSAGCVGYLKNPIKSTPTPAPTVTATPSPEPTKKPVNETVERHYQYIEKFYAGIEKFNRGIDFIYKSQSYANDMDWNNASSYALKARDSMEDAKVLFKDMEQYALNDNELRLSQKWYETADHSSVCYGYHSDAYIEHEFQDSKETPNYIKFNYYVEQANHYNSLAQQSRMQAEELQSGVNTTIYV